MQNQLLLQRRLPEVSVEEAQEDVQGADEATRHRSRAPHPPQGIALLNMCNSGLGLETGPKTSGGKKQLKIEKIQPKNLLS
tara:strand:+ start:352 stop:594 length:243 start_codon:yes stop_codon:yes gene_type:complete